MAENPRERAFKAGPSQGQQGKGPSPPPLPRVDPNNPPPPSSGLASLGDLPPIARLPPANAGGDQPARRRRRASGAQAEDAPSATPTPRFGDSEPPQPESARGKRPSPLETRGPPESQNAPPVQEVNETLAPKRLFTDDVDESEASGSLRDYDFLENEPAQKKLLVVEPEDVVEHLEEQSTPHRILRSTHALERSVREASQGRRGRELPKPKVFYENMYTGSFDRVAVAKKETVSVSDTEHELKVLTAGISFVMGIETSLGFFLRGLLAGLALLSLIATYNNCSLDHFGLCYAIAVGSVTQKVLSAMLTLATVLMSVQYSGLRARDSFKHKLLVSSAMICYVIAFVASALATPVDDQLYSLRNSLSLSTVTEGTPDVLQGNSYELGIHFQTANAWHAFNVIRLVFVLVGWGLTGVDLLDATRQSWVRFQDSNGEQPLETNALLPSATVGLSIR